jgi:hypothetical protein
MGLGMETKTTWQLKPHTSSMLVSLYFCRLNEGICKLWLNGTSLRICPSTRCKKPRIKNHLGHTWYDFKTYKPFPLVIFASFRVNRFCVFWFDWMEIMFCRYKCGYAPKDPQRPQPHEVNQMRLFGPLKRFYT